MQRWCKKVPLCGIAVFYEKDLFCSSNLTLGDYLKLFFMKLLSESIKSFVEGFISFYTSIYHEMKSW